MLRSCAPVLLTAVTCFAATEVVFQPDKPSQGPFPSNALTIADGAQRTKIRVNLPLTAEFVPGTPLFPQEVGMLNQLDGFSLNPMLRVCFSAKVKADTLEDGVYLQRGSTKIRINRILLDAATNHCLMAKPDQVLAPGSTYSLVVTNSVRDASNSPVVRSQAFSDCLKSSSSTAPCKPADGGDTSESVVARTTFTTLSARSWLEQAQAFVNSKADVSFIAPPTSVELTKDTAKWEYSAQGKVPSTPMTANLSHLLSDVSRVSFGVIQSPNFLSFAPDENGNLFSIPQKPTSDPIQLRTDLPYVPVSYHIFYPKFPPIFGGYPVAIYLHGMGDTRFGASSYIAGTLAKFGIATLSFEVHGHGYGQGSSLKVGSTAPFPSPGRGVSLAPQGGPIGDSDGCIAIDVLRGGPSPVGARDCIRQTAVDVMALIRMLRTSGAYSSSGDRKLRLDTNRIYLIGQSLGAITATLAAAAEPNVRASVLNVPGGSYVDVVRLAQIRQIAGLYIATRNPALLDGACLDPNGQQMLFVDDGYVLRDLPPAEGVSTNDLKTQAMFEVADWVGQSGDALAYAGELKDERKLIQIALGDGEVPNPTNSAFIRAADARSSTRLFRFDRAQNYTSPDVTQPHRFLSNPGILDQGKDGQKSVAVAAQTQVATFLAVDGLLIPDANWFLTSPYRGQQLFETPQSLPETLGFTPINPCQLPTP